VKPVFESAQLRVYDDVLSADAWRQVWTVLQLERYESIQSGQWLKVWRFTDGAPLASVPMVYGKLREPGSPGVRPYPSRTGLDAVMDSVLEQRSELEPLVGREGHDWVALSARSYLYKAGMRLAWHQDQSIYSGSFIFFAHREWNVLWGGELMVADESCRGADLGNGSVVTGGSLASATTTRIPQFLENERENAALSALGMGRYIVPKPNRLVVLAGGHPHQINAVHPDAGQHLRCTVSGFFHREPA
jgi:hypothetical protein